MGRGTVNAGFEDWGMSTLDERVRKVKRKYGEYPILVASESDLRACLTQSFSFIKDGLSFVVAHGSHGLYFLNRICLARDCDLPYHSINTTRFKVSPDPDKYIIEFTKPDFCIANEEYDEEIRKILMGHYPIFPYLRDLKIS